MLVLSRTIDQKVFIDGPCVVTLVEMRRGHVKLGFEADASVNIARAELLDCDGKPKNQIKRGAE